MHPARLRFAIVNLLGGTAVLASYAHGLLTHPAARLQLWGGVPEAVRPVYQVSMLLAAAGYFPMTALFWLRAGPETARFGRFRLDHVTALYLGILLPSALWMPLTFRMLEQPSDTLWWWIRADLALVGLCSLAVLWAVLALRPDPGAGWRRSAALGAVCFCVQTALLDALLWPVWFPR
jgi:hypothetical protein